MQHDFSLMHIISRRALSRRALSRRTLLHTVLGGGFLLFSGCGKKGKLEAPGDKPSSFPRSYPHGAKKYIPEKNSKK